MASTDDKSFDDNTAQELIKLALKATFNDVADQQKLINGIQALEKARQEAGPAALRRKELENQSYH